MVKYQKWIDKNTHKLKNKLVILVGATGSTGSKLLDYLLYLEANVIIAARNINKALSLKNKMLLKYPNAQIYVEHLDISSLESIDLFQLNIDKKYPKADFFVNNSGVYHLPNSFSKDGYEIHFATNNLGAYYLTKKILFNLNSHAKIVLVGSLSYRFYKIDYSDIQSTRTNKKMRKYAISKRILMLNAQFIKEQLEPYKYSVNIAHPGICATQLFDEGHSKFFKIFIKPIMKVLFHKPDKAALSLLKAMFEDTKIGEWIGPRGLFHVWGYPKVSKLHKSICNKESYLKVNKITEDMIVKHKC